MKRRVQNRALQPRDEKKEAIFKELSLILKQSGIQVRREQLKQGHGWRVVSGTCRLKESSMIFVDRRMSQEDQIAFLISKFAALNIRVPQDKMAVLPSNLIAAISAGIQSTPVA